MRYFSDSSYWIYLAHVPLVMVGHLLVTGLPVHFHLKFLLVCGGVTLLLLAAYRIGVRYTFVGRALNGPRQPRERAAAPTPAA